MNRSQVIEALVKMGISEERAIEVVEFHINNPHIFKAFCAKAEALLRAGRKRYGSKAIFEVLRYETAVSGGTEFKLNNNLTSLYARLWAIKYPKQSDFFETREAA